MNAKTFVSNAEGEIQGIEITELETAAGRTVRIMFEDVRMDDVRITLSKDGRVRLSFYTPVTEAASREVVHIVGSKHIGWDRSE